MEAKQLLKYVHHQLDEEITAIGGHYVVNKEYKLPVADREALVTVGYGVMDTTCCGTGGCSYATVHGFIVEWQSEINADGLAVTKVEPIRDEEIRKTLKDSILNREQVQQVNFL